MTSFVTLLLPLMYMARTSKRGAGAQFHPLDELKIRGMTNTALEMTLSLERALIVAGVSFPVGGSLLVVAQKGRL